MEDIKTLSFEQALEALELIAKTLESGNISLDESIKIFDRGNQLKKHCEQILKNAKLKVEKIVQNEDGSVSSEPFESEE